jgi:hypothetical protein
MIVRPAASLVLPFAILLVTLGCAADPSHQTDAARGPATTAPATQPDARVLDQIIAAITDTARRVRTVHIESFDLTVEQAADVKSEFKPTPARYQGSAWFDMGDGLSNYGWARARVRFDTLVREWENGAAPWYDQELDLSFDGTHGKSIRISGRGLPGGTRHPDNAAWIYDEPPAVLGDPGLRQACGLEFALWWSQEASHPPDPPRTSRQPHFARYLAERKQNGMLPQIGRERVNDVDTVRLRWEREGKDADGTVLRTVRTWWLDPARGYSLIRRERTWSNVTFVERVDVTELVEVVPGVWYPTAGVLDDLALSLHPAEMDHRPIERRRFKVTDVTLNQPIPDALFSPAIPPGYQVIDRGQIYIALPDATIRPIDEAPTHPRLRPGTHERPE